MKVEKTNIDGVLLINSPKFSDNRGYFFEFYNKEAYLQHGIDLNFVQDNVSLSKPGVVRGLHGQANPNQVKIVRCLAGAIYDVALDIRPNSKTFMQYLGFELSAENNCTLVIPHGCLHGFSVIGSRDACVMYKVSGCYNKAGEYGINPLSAGIDWKISDDMIISQRDTGGEDLENFLQSSRFLNEICNTF